jgi:RNA polymerase sigma-70 factor (ECF subfamily)
MRQSPDDRELLAAAAAGDPAARDAFVRRYRPRVFALGLQLSGSRAEAEDLAQDVMLAALSALPSFRGHSEIFTWLYRIAVRRALRTRRKHARLATEESSEDARLELALAVDAGPDPRKQLELREQYRMLLCALDALPPKLRAAVVLIAVHGLTLAEASEALGVTEGTVGWRVHEARKQMRHTLERLSRPGRWAHAAPRAPTKSPRAFQTIDSLRAALLGYPELEL